MTGGSKQVAKNLEPRIAVKQPMKKNVVSKKVLKKLKVILKQTECLHAYLTKIQLSSDYNFFQRTSGSEVEGWAKELSDFRKEVFTI